jgi:hypothetical protein
MVSRALALVFVASFGMATSFYLLLSLGAGGDVREPLLDAVAERIRTRMGDRASRRYLSVLRAGQRSE